jgi:hypothetical protein
MSVTVVNTDPVDGGPLTALGNGTVQARGTFDETATIQATLVYGSSTWNANENGNRFIVQPPQPGVQWSVTFGPPGGLPVPGGLQGCTLTVTGTADDGAGSSIITVSTPPAMGQGNGAIARQRQRNARAARPRARQRRAAI